MRTRTKIWIGCFAAIFAACAGGYGRSVTVRAIGRQTETNQAPYFVLTKGFLAYSKIVTVKNTSVTVTYPAEDPDGDALSYSLTVQPAHGAAEVDPETGAITYRPETGYVGQDSLAVQASDGKGGSTSLSIPIVIVEDRLIRVACVGDSLTYGSGATSAEKRYPDRLQSLLGETYWVENFGLPATTLMSQTSYPYTGTTFYGNSLEWNPHIVILMLGTNDATTGAVNRKEDTFLAEYQELIRSYQELPSQPAVFVVTPPPAKENATQKNLDRSIWRLVRQAAEQTGCRIIDLQERISLDGDLFFDTIHLNDAGYEIFGQTVYESVSQLEPEDLPGLGDIASPSANSKATPGLDRTSGGAASVSFLLWLIPLIAACCVAGMIAAAVLLTRKR